MCIIHFHAVDTSAPLLAPAIVSFDRRIQFTNARLGEVPDV